jgi:UDPglucose 6-dehydrogenase
MKIAAVGTGDVGSSNAILLSQHHEVVCLNIISEHVDSINRNVSLIVDAEIKEYL